jgi:hypothetical protein
VTGELAAQPAAAVLAGEQGAEDDELERSQ